MHRIFSGNLQIKASVVGNENEMKLMGLTSHRHRNVIRRLAHPPNQRQWVSNPRHLNPKWNALFEGQHSQHYTIKDGVLITSYIINFHRLHVSCDSKLKMTVHFNNGSNIWLPMVVGIFKQMLGCFRTCFKPKKYHGLGGLCLQ